MAIVVKKPVTFDCDIYTGGTLGPNTLCDFSLSAIVSKLLIEGSVGNLSVRKLLIGQ